MDLSREPIARREPLPTTVLAMLAVAVGALAGGMVVVAGLPFAAIFAILPAVALVMLRSIWVGLAGVLVVIYVVPFAVVPIGGPITPTLLELALAYFLVASVAIAALDRRVSLAIGWPEALVALLVGITVLAFLLGLGRNYTTQTVHDFGRFVLAIATFYLVRQLIRSPSDGRLLVVLLIVGSGIAAGIALILYAGGPFVTLRILGRLVPYGYPAADIVRYIEDNPARAMRATGTSVDPNAFGGMMMVGFLLAMTQTLTPSRAIPGWLAGSARMGTIHKGHGPVPVASSMRTRAGRLSTRCHAPTHCGTGCHASS